MSVLNDNYALAKRDGQARTNYDFVPHLHWEPSGNCTTTYCMLAKDAPLHIWTSVGNGSYNGVPHEVHFINTGTNHGYSVTRGLHSNSTIEQRGIPLAQTNYAQILFNPNKLTPLVAMDTSDFGDFDKPLIDLGAKVAIDTANKNFTTICTVFKDNNTAIANNGDNTNLAEGVFYNPYPDVAVSYLSSADIDRYVASCGGDAADPHTFVIYPRDGNDVDTLSELLATFPNANLATYNSLNDYGVLYWTATLTASQWIKVTQNKQVGNSIPFPQYCTNNNTSVKRLQPSAKQVVATTQPTISSMSTELSHTIQRPGSPIAPILLTPSNYLSAMAP